MISVIVPIYNVEKYIVKCLESIVNQDYADFELILVNDGTKDASIDLAKAYLKSFCINWKVVDKENGGLASARNAGIKQAKGEYIAFVDSDDAISKDFLSTMYSHIKDTDTNFVFCNFEYVKQQIEPNDNNDRIICFDKEKLMSVFLKRTINFVVPSMMFKKDFIIDNDLFFNEEIRFSEDQPFIWNVILHSNKSIYLYKKMYGYYIRENSIMTATSYDKLIKSYDEYSSYIDNLMKQYPQQIDTLKMVLPRWKLGTLYTASKLVDFDQYINLYKHMNARTILFNILSIGELKSYLLAIVCFISCRLLYVLCRKMSLNG